MLKIFFWFLTFIITVVNAGKIFAIVPYSGKSHFAVIEPLLKRLAERGHEVDVATHYPTNSKLPRYNEISLVRSTPIFRNNVSIHDLDVSTYTLLKLITTNAGTGACSGVFNMPKIQKIISSPQKYDLLISEIDGSECELGLGHLFNATIMSYVACTSLPWANDRIGGIDNPSYIPNFFFHSTFDRSFYQRVENTFLWVFTKVTYYFLQTAKSEEINKKFFGSSAPTVEELIQKTSLIMYSRHFSMNHITPAIPNFIEVGGLHIDKPTSLSKYYEDLLNTTSKGVIFVTMGSMIMTESFEPEKLQGMFDAFAELSYNVLWKADVNKFPKTLRIPKNIHFENWMPQFDILCHPKVKMFVTHGGLLGSQEAIYCGVPRLGIPIFSDQKPNILESEKIGTAIKVSYSDINKETILTASRKLLNDPRYKKNAQRISSIFRDRPVSPLEEAVYWTEYLIKYKGAPHLRNKAADLSWWQYYLVDVILVVVLPVLILFVITFKISKILYRANYHQFSLV